MLAGVFERFTEEARRVVVLAQEEARTLGHAHIGSEHLLLGLLRREDDGAAAVLGDLGIDLARGRAAVEEIVGRGEDSPAGQIPFTPRAKKALELALREALSLGHNYIGPEHILLALLRLGSRGTASRVIDEAGIGRESLREEITRRLGVARPSGGEETPLRRLLGRVPGVGGREERHFERFTELARQVVVLAQEEARTLKHNYIGTEHILLGLVRENEGVAARILLDFDADSEKIRNEVIRMLSGPGGREEPSRRRSSPAWSSPRPGRPSCAWHPSVAWPRTCSWAT